MSAGYLIDKDIGNIIEILKENDILKIIAPTSAGKTVRLPQLLADNGYSVLVSTSNYNLPSLPFTFPFTTKTEERKNRVKYISNKDLINNFNKEIKGTEILIIDEVDTGSLENYVLMSLWKNNKDKYTNNKDTNNKYKLILTSNLEHNFFPDYPNYFVKPYFKYHTEIKYLKDYPDFLSSSDDIISIISSSVSSYSINDKNFDILVFVPDKDAVNVIVNKLNDYSTGSVKKISEKFDILSIYEDSPDIQKIYEEEKEEQQEEKEEQQQERTKKILVSTDIAKTGLGIKNVKIIIDSMKEIRGHINVMGGYRTGEEYISKRDAELRASRGGVFSECLVYRCISKDSFDALPDFTEEVILRTPLHYSIIDLIKLSTSSANTKNLLHTLNEIEGFIETYRLMLNYHLIDIGDKITPKGEKIRNLLFSLKNSIIYWYLKENKIKNAKLIVALIDQYDDNVFLLHQGFKKNDETSTEDNQIYKDNSYRVNRDIHIKTYFNPFRGRDDLETCINVWNSFANSLNFTNKHAKSQNYLSSWSEANFINSEYLSFVSTLKKEKFITFEDKEREIMDQIMNKLYKKAHLNKDDKISAIYSFVRPCSVALPQTCELTKSCSVALPQTCKVSNLREELHNNDEYRISFSSINTIDQTRPLHIYPILTLSLSEVNNYSLFSYVSSDVKYEKSVPTTIKYP